MEQGTVIKWIEDRGFGFIAADLGGADIFLHVRAFAEPVIPAVGDRVTFAVEVREQGARATQATLCSEVV